MSDNKRPFAAFFRPDPYDRTAGGMFIMRRNFLSRFLLYIVVFAVAFGVTFGILRLGDRSGASADAAENELQTIPPETPFAAENETAAAAPAQTDEPEQTAEPDSADSAEAGQAEPETQTESAQPHSITPPYHEQAAPDDYFEDALFFGNSLLEGLGAYSLIYDENIAKASFDTATSMTIFGAADYINDAANGGYGKIYIGLGLNEIGFDREAIRAENEKAIDTIRAGNPDAIIYIFSLTPISSYRSSNDSLYNNENASKISQVLREVAEEKECYFMDMVPVLGDSSGCLPSDVTADGVHFTREYYQNWYDYLEHNYVLP